MGGDTQARARHVVAIGDGAMTWGEYSIAIGRGAKTESIKYDVEDRGSLYRTAESAIALGMNSTANGYRSIAQGVDAKAERDHSIAIGSNAQVLVKPSATRLAGEGNVAIGRNALIGNNVGRGSTAIGYNAKVLGVGSIQMAVGAESVSTGSLTSAVGMRAQAHGDTTSVFGNHAQVAGGFDNAAIGVSAFTGSSFNQAAIGVGTIAKNRGTVAIGSGSMSFGKNSTVIGATGGVYRARVGQALEGKITKITDQNFSIVGGDGNTAIGNANLIGDTSHDNLVLGNQVKIGADSASVTRSSTELKASNKKVEYYDCTAIYEGKKSVNRAIAIGQGVKVAADDAIAQGTSASAMGDSAIAIGTGAQSKEVAENGIAFGTRALTNAADAIAVGTLSKSSGESAVTIGKKLIL
ncbi:hypothetical protein [Moraxella bovoculi]